jgi:hypothetical protein
MSMKKKKSATVMPTATSSGGRSPKKKIFERIITGNKETEGPTVVETNEKMQET